MNFEQLYPADYSRLKPYFTRQAYPLCVYSLPSMIAWSNVEYRPLGAIEDDALIVAAEFSRHKENRHLILPISPHRPFSPEDLHAIIGRSGFEHFWFVPDAYLERFPAERIEALFRVEEQTEYHDYVYLTSDLAELRGNKYSKKRNLIHQFERKYLSRERVAVEPLTSAIAEECIRFLDRWCEEAHCDVDQDEDLACERQAIINTLENIETLQVKGLYVRVDGVFSAFAVASHLTADMGVLHFEKALTSIKGLYQYFDSLCAQRFFNGCTYINKESDMNLPGLAKAKKSYHPFKMIRSVKLILNN